MTGFIPSHEPQSYAALVTVLLRRAALVSIVMASCDAQVERAPIANAVASPIATVITPVDANAADAGPRAEDPFAALDVAVNRAVAEGKMPGAVVIVGRRDGVVLKRAYGSRAIEPARTTMTSDTVFDLASLTKPIATATSIMILVERKRVALDVPAAKYIPELAKLPPFTVRQLLLHTSGLPAGTALDDWAHGMDEALKRLAMRKLGAQPGEKFVYSDIGYIVLAEIVHRVSGSDLSVFATHEIFEPLGMKETRFLPPSELKARAAPTEQRDGAWMIGDVHDPIAWALGGVAGNAGLFSTGDDLARFARAMLERGELDGHRVFSNDTARLFFGRNETPRGGRALGWDMDSPFATNRASALSAHAFGHGGFTGTAMWIDPDKDFFVVFLSNRVHPDGRGAVNPLVAEIGSLAMHAMETRTGVDVLRAEQFARLSGKRIGLITNASARTSDGTKTLDAFRAESSITLAVLFSPEHGLDVDRDAKVSDSDASGIPVYSLYGEHLAPQPDALRGLDALVFDLQDAGVRFYTYASTMRLAMKAAKAAHVRFVVLDRPNPLGGVDVQGPVFSGTFSFVNHAALPIRHGMTMGELAKMFADEDHTDVEVAPMERWRRAEYFDETGLAWVSPSPNLRSVAEVVLYPALGLLEGTNVSVGRGTDTPFEVLGAPWIDGDMLASALGREPGVAFAKTTFTPTSSMYRGERCGGVRVSVTDRARFDPVRTGVAIAAALHAKYPEWKIDRLAPMLGSATALGAIRAGKSADDVVATWTSELDAFRKKREPYLLYSK